MMLPVYGVAGLFGCASIVGMGKFLTGGHVLSRGCRLGGLLRNTKRHPRVNKPPVAPDPVLVAEHGHAKNVPADPGGNMRTNWISGYTDDEMRELQKSDDDITDLLTWIQEGHKPDRQVLLGKGHATRHYWLLWDQLVIQNGVLYKRYYSRDNVSSLQLVVPHSLYQEVLKNSHNSVTSGHLGVRKTQRKIRRSFYWYKMKASIRDWIRKCATCGARKRPQKAAKAPVGTRRVGGPLDRLATDIAGPFPLSDNGNKYILVVMDYFTKWVEAYAIPDSTAATVADKIVTEFISRFGIPLEIHSDQGRNYESHLFKQMCELLDITKSRTTPYRPQSNGMIERFNRTLLDMISSYVYDHQRNWDIHLPLLTMAYRSCEHDSTGYSPNYLMLGREVYLPSEILYGDTTSSDDTNINEYVITLKDTMRSACQHARASLEKTIQTQQRNFDTKIVKHNFVVGDVVYCLDSTRKVGKSPKLQSRKWKGPYVIVKKLSDLVFELKGSPNSRAHVIHHNRLKPYLSDVIPDWLPTLRNKVMTKSDSKSVQDNSTSTADLEDTALSGDTVASSDNAATNNSAEIGEDVGPRRSKRTKKPTDRYT